MSKTRSAAKPARARLGSSFGDLLQETGDYDVVRRDALKRVLAWQLEEARAAEGLTKAALAARLNTSRSQLDRLLDPDNADVTLAALERVARALGRSVRLELAEAEAKPAARMAPKAVARKGVIGTGKTVAKPTVKTPLAAKISRRAKPTGGARIAARSAKGSAKKG